MCVCVEYSGNGTTTAIDDDSITVRVKKNNNQILIEVYYM